MFEHAQKRSDLILAEFITLVEQVNIRLTDVPLEKCWGGGSENFLLAQFFPTPSGLQEFS